MPYSELQMFPFPVLMLASHRSASIHPPSIFSISSVTGFDKLCRELEPMRAFGSWSFRARFPEFFMAHSGFGPGLEPLPIGVRNASSFRLTR